MADIGHLRCTFSDHREDANGTKRQSLFMGVAQLKGLPY